MKSVLFSLLATAFILAVGPASAHEFKAGSIEIKHPWSRATPKGSEVAGGFMKLINTGTEPDRLIGGSTANAGKFEIHESAMEGGVMKMRALPSLELPSGKAVELKPGGHHVMLFDLKQQIKARDSVPLTLDVIDPGGKRRTLEVSAAVRPLGAH